MTDREKLHSKNLKIHLGCGKRFIPGFIHVDQVSYSHVDYIGPIHNLPMFDDSSAKLIYVCQALSYYDQYEVVQCLKEWRRILMPGGVLRLSVQNFKVISALYEAGFPLERFLGTLYGRIPNGDVGFVYHKTIFDEASLAKLFLEAGFSNPRLWNWRDTEHSEVDDYSQAYFPHMDKTNGILFNLNMEASK